ncbi:hypothetical protein [Streptomyces sp. SBT349]|uniref:hypothetical protein n=1 Tax=Streptomyces sp. SBT349 TaxID=1580539 RepID=UPI00066BBB9D|nr:hypothetical protein [Streptomyces sp. SBT349]
MTADPHAGWPAPPQAAPPGPVPPPWGPGPLAPVQVPVPVVPRNGQGMASLVLAGAAAAFCWTFALSVVGLVLGLLAMLFGIAGLVRAGQGLATNRGVALGGLWTGAGATAVSAVLTVVFFVWTAALTPVVSEAGADYLAAVGEEVTYEDGISVTIEEPSPMAGEGAASVTVRVVNGGEDTVGLGSPGIVAAVDGEEIEGRDVLRETDDVGELAPGDSREIRYRVALPEARPAYLSVDFSPGEDHAFAYWDLALEDAGEEGGPSPEEPGGPGGPGEEDTPGGPGDIPA